MSRYVVIGGGMSGLAAARRLAGATPVSHAADAEAATGGRRGAPPPSGEVVLLEASGRLGGKVLTGSFAGGPIELGPDQFLRRDPSAERLCRQLGLGDDLVAPAAGAAAVLAAGRPRELPAGLVLGIPSDLDALAASGIVSGEAVEFARGDAQRPGPVLTAGDVGLDGSAAGAGPDRERSAGAILRPRLGDEIVNRLVDPLLGGINAGSIDNLSLGTVAPQVARALVGHRDVIAPLAAMALSPAGRRTGASQRRSEARPSPFLGLAGGLGRLVSGLEEELRRLGCDVRLACPALRIRPARAGGGYVVETPAGEIAADGIVVALPARPSASVLNDLAPAAAARLRTISYASVAVVTFAFDRPLPRALSGWSGVLVPRGEGTLMTAVTLLSEKWPWLRGGALGRPLVRVSAGRHLDARIDSLCARELSQVLAGELAEVAGIDAPVADGHVQRWPEALPQYEPGHAARMEAIRHDLDELSGVALAGAALGGIGIPACITSGERAAEAVSASVAACA